jgi:DNA primase
MKLKRYLYKNPSLIVSLLERLNCHHIKLIKGKRIQGALPDGDNVASVQVLLGNEYLNTVVHTRTDYDGSDIFDFVEYILKCNFRQAINWVSGQLNIAYVDLKDYNKPKFLNILDEFAYCEESENTENEPISEKVLDTFIRAAHKDFTEDGISPVIQDKMGILFDTNDSRILIPIRDENGNLITLKGRTTIKDHKEQGIPKYISYFNYYATNILYGYYENYFNILNAGEVIIVESEKSVLQAMSMGINNVVALSKHVISDRQLELILKLNCDVVLALDKDMDREYCISELNKFDNLCTKYLIIDNDDLLDEKDSPFDRGLQVWNELYSQKELIE